MNKLLFVVVAGCWTTPPPEQPAPYNRPRQIVVTPPTPQMATDVRIVGMVRTTDGATGAISGRVEDGTNEPLAGVTVVAASPALAGVQTAITDEKGEFKISPVPPSSYTVTFYYNDVTLAHTVPVTAHHLTRLKVERWTIPPWSDR